MIKTEKERKTISKEAKGVKQSGKEQGSGAKMGDKSKGEA